MKRIKVFLYFVLIALGLSILSGCTPRDYPVIPSDSDPSPVSPYRDIDKIDEGKIVDLHTGIEVSEEKFIDLLSQARVIYVGEVHDSLEDHRVQLNILKMLWERFPGKIAVGMEMFRRPVQPDLDRWIEGRLGDRDFQRIWYDNWRVDFGYYKDLIVFIKENKIPIIALNAPHEMEVKVREKGVSGLSQEDQKRLPETDRNDPYHRKALEAIFKGHSTGSAGFDAFYDTMLLWDESMAESIAQYLASPEGGNKKMVIFAGGFHVSHGFGIPRRAFRRLQEPYKIVIPYVKDAPEEKKMMDVKLPDLPLLLSDYVWVIRYRELEGKRILLGVQIEPFQEGIRVVGVSPGSAADEAGIKAKDIIVTFDGQAIKEPFDLIYVVQQKKGGDKVRVGIIREGKKIETEVVMKPSQHP